MKKQSEGGIRMNRTEYRSNYLQSEWWKEKREKILDRDITCRICEKNPSNEVHHLSYEHLYAERNCELIGICRPCHDTIHGCKILSRMISPWIIKMLIVLTPAESPHLQNLFLDLAKEKKRKDLGGLTHLVECLLCKQDVTSSSLVSSTQFWAMGLQGWSPHLQ
jgi:hypothetical protein